MSEKNSKKNRVDLDKLDFGIDIETGVIVIGEANEEGVIDTEKSKDVTESFFSMVQTIGMLKMKVMQQEEEKQQKKPHIIKPTTQDMQRLGEVESYD